MYTCRPSSGQIFCRRWLCFLLLRRPETMHQRYVWLREMDGAGNEASGRLSSQEHGEACAVASPQPDSPRHLYLFAHFTRNWTTASRFVSSLALMP